MSRVKATGRVPNNPPSPSSVGGLAIWLDSLMGVTSSSGIVTGWSDQSGVGNNFTGDVSGHRPSLVTGFNGYPTVNFNTVGSGTEWLICSNTPTMNTGTWFVVMTMQANSGFGAILVGG